MTWLAEAFTYLAPAFQGGRRLQRALEQRNHVQYNPKNWDSLKKAEQIKAIQDWKKERDAAQELKDLGDTSSSVLKALSSSPPTKRRSSFIPPQADFSQALAEMRALPVKPRESSEQMDSQQREHHTSRLKTYRRIMNARKAVRRLLRTGG